MAHRKESKKAMKKVVIILAIVIVIIAGGYLWTKSGQQPIEQKQTGTFSQNYDNAPQVTQPKVVELKNGQNYDMTASIVKNTINGHIVKMLAYNGSIPGPIIKVQQDSEITLNFANNIDVDSTIHPHGVRLDNAFDGVPNVTQKAVSVGGKFSYKIKFPDAGIYWYHPHIREDYTQALGLYGNFIVEPKEQNYYSPVNQEIPLFLSDILLEDGSTAPYNKAVSNYTLMGRFGNQILVNGQTNYSQTIHAGEVVRFYLTNSASTRIFNFSIPGEKIKLVGGDNGKYEKEAFVDSVQIAPAEREIIDVLFDKPGAYTLTHTTPQKTYAIGTIRVTDDKVVTSYQNEFNTLRTNQDVEESIAPFKNSFNKPDDKSITLSLSMQGMGNMDEQNGTSMHMMHNGSMMQDNQMMDNNTQQNGTNTIEWEDTMGMMNVMSNAEMVKWKLVDDQTKKENSDIQWTFHKGDKVKIKIYNDPKSQHPMQHPIHIHGQRFLVLSTNGVENTNLVWKDTALVPSGTTTEILVDMSNPGIWMMHCHIPEHLESGMMFGFKVI